MRTRIIRSRVIRTAALAFALTAFGAGPADAKQYTRPTVVEGAIEKADDFYRAGPLGAVYAIPGGGQLRLSPFSEFRFAMPMQLELSKGGKTRTFVVTLRSGRADVRYEKQKGPPASALLVHASRRIAGVVHQGRALFISGETTTIANYEGELLLGIGTDWKPMKHGITRSFGKTEKGEPEPIVKAPDVQLSKRLVVIDDEQKVGVSWKAVPGAARYEATLRGNGAEVRVGTSGTSAELPVSDIGRFEVELRSFDRHGVASAGSTSSAFETVSLRMPGHAYIGDDGAVRLGYSERVGLVGAERLKLSYDRSSYFVSAPADVGLNRGRATLVRLRAPSSTDEARVQLVPRMADARISFSPEKPSWPAHEIEIRVQLLDGRGEPTRNAADPVRTRVQLDGRVLQTEFTRDGGTLKATIPPLPVTDGPWRLDVELTDERGSDLARRSVKIANTY